MAGLPNRPLVWDSDSRIPLTMSLPQEMGEKAIPKMFKKEKNKT
jgi:hypothetical protein